MDDEAYEIEVRYTTHPRAVAGIMVMASIMLFAVIFAIALFLAGVFMPPDTMRGVVVYDPVLSDYITAERILIASIAAGVVTALFWVLIPDGD